MTLTVRLSTHHGHLYAEERSGVSPGNMSEEAERAGRLRVRHSSGSLREALLNFPQKAKTLATRWNRGVYRDARRPSGPRIVDARGPVARTIATVQTFLTAAEIDQLVGDYLAGGSPDELAERYGIHRATVFAHLRRRDVPRRRAGLDEVEAAEAVRLYRRGTSIRVIARGVGVDRKAVRRALEVAGIATRPC